MEQVDDVAVMGLRIAYRRAGTGPALVLLHGAFGFDSRTWQRQIEDLADAFTVVAWDAPGCGQSSDPLPGFSAGDYADCLAGLINALGLRRPHLLGLSFGAVLALEFYRRYPTIPRTLVLASAYAGWAGSLPPEVVEQRKQHVAHALNFSPAAWAAEWSPGMVSDRAPAAVVDDIVASLAAFRPAGQRAMFAAFAELDLRAVLPSIGVPTLLLYGDQDVRSPTRAGEALHASIPGSHLVVLPGVGHVSNMEAPERFNAAVRAFLNAVRV